MTADAESQRVANVEGTRHMVEFADAVDAGCVHMVSSIAAAGLYKGTWREDMFDEAQDARHPPVLPAPSTSPRAWCATSATRPWRVYRPGIVVGNSETGEMDKVDGPYYFFKLIRRIRNAVPQWLPMPGVEGREINIVPVDFVVKAMDHIAHAEGLDGRAFHLTDPNPLTAGEVIDIFAQRRARAAVLACGCPPGRSRRSSRCCRRALDRDAARRRGHRPRCSPTSGSRARCWSTSTTRPTSTRARPQAALEGTGISGAAAGGLRGQALGLLGAPPRPRPVPRQDPARAPREGASAWSAASAEIIEQQVPDELMRLGRRAAGQRLAREPRSAGASSWSPAPPRGSASRRR